MAGQADIFHADFRPEPYWWQAFRPAPLPHPPLPASTEVAIVGGGYAGVSAARVLGDHGTSCVVFEAGDFGSGASTRSGGAISAGLSVGKSFTGKALDFAPELVKSTVGWAQDAFAFLEATIAAEGIDCAYEKRGRFLGACASRHFDELRTRFDKLRASGAGSCRLVDRIQQREEIGSDFYHGGLVFDEAGKLHPALLYKGLLDAARRRESVVLSGNNAVRALERVGDGWRVASDAGSVTARQVLVATNGYTSPLTPGLRRRLMPIASHILATEELPEGWAQRFSPKGRTFSETRRVLHYYRVSPDGKRVIFGGRSRFTDTPPEISARLLHRALVRRFPEFDGVKVTHGWQGTIAFTFDALPHAGELDGLHYVLGCNGSGVSMMPFLGAMMGRRLAGRLNSALPFEAVPLPSMPFYDGNPWFLPLAGGLFRFRDFVDERVLG